MKAHLLNLVAVSLLCCGMATGAAAAEAKLVPKPETPEQHAARMQWWREARFGMFIHWGAYAVPADGEWYMTTHHVPIAEYEKFAARFNPVKFDADRWASIAQEAGMKYLVITAKHHDGFCMFKTGTTKYNIVDATPWHHDPLADLSAAFKRHGVRFCCYYSIMDWHSPDQSAAKPDALHPDYNPTSFPSAAKKAAYIRYMKGQLKDLITQYHPGVIWFDGGWINGGWTNDDGRDLLAYLHQLDPELIVNNRASGPGDYGTPEQSIPGGGQNGDWETCMTINGSWGYNAGDQGFKSTRELLRNLIDIASKGGNYLLNVGPTAEGVIPEPEVERLKEMGAWLKANGAAVYGTSGGPFKKPLPWGRATQMPGKLYLEVFDWPKDGTLVVPMANQATRAYLLARPADALPLKTAEDGVHIAVPAAAPDKIASVVVVELEGPVVSSPAGMIRPAADGSIALLAVDADITGSQLNVEGGEIKNLGFWTDARDYASWPVQVGRPGTYKPRLTYSLANRSSEIVLSAGNEKSTARVAGTGGWDNYKTIELPALTIAHAGVNVISLKAARSAEGGLLNLRKIELTTR